jgi:ATP-dependent helicase HepA
VLDQLVRQWTDELHRRFDLSEVEVLPHSALCEKTVAKTRYDVVVIDEAHRIVSQRDGGRSAAWEGAAKIARNSRHLLLLSATPVLHEDSELLALLELLDPRNYSSDNLIAFQERTAQRRNLGRAFLALQSARAAPLIRQNAKKLAELLPADGTVQRLATEFTATGADLLALRRELHLHISETYRIYRRMLRTRRRWLAEADQHFIRIIEERTELELDEGPHERLWQVLEEWRTETAARVADSQALFATCAKEYVHLAETIAAQPDRLANLVEDVAAKTNAAPTERTLLDELADPHLAKTISRARAELVVEVLRRRAARDGSQAKFVVFCPSTDVCRKIAAVLKSSGEDKLVRLANHDFSHEEVGEIFSQFANDPTRILLTDETGEEGFNLQFARGLVLYDLPWSPMRVEQRLGRLDRIERTGKILCFDITTGEDETLCVDEAWRLVLAEGFGIFKHSISDLQHLVDVEMPHLCECVFCGGPSALVAEIPSLALRVAKEREQIEEQDVIDGMHSLSPNSPLCRDLAQADAEADDFGRALSLYLQENAGLRQRWDEENNSFSFALPQRRHPLIPVDRLMVIGYGASRRGNRSGRYPTPSPGP